VQLHHPDHNDGSPESARRFEEVQDAYAQIMAERRRRPTPRRTGFPPATDPDIEQRIANLERELREKARAAREKAQRAAREAAANYKRPSDEELGIFHTDDSIGKILHDAREEFSRRVGEVREEPVTHRAADLLDDIASWLKHDPDSGDDDKNQARKRPG